VEDKSPSLAIMELEAQIRQLLANINPQTMGSKTRKVLADLGQVLIDSRIYARDYELSETRQEQFDNADRGKHYLEKARKDILIASEEDVFGAIDVAYMTAVIDQVISKLK
jgi:hypothetical protein